MDGAVIVATDGHPDYPAKVGENMGMARMPPTEQSAGEGWLTDRFGINWTVRIERG